MKTNRTLSKLTAAALLACGLSASAQTRVTWTGTTGDFYDPTKWDTGAFPTGMDYGIINNGGTATIGATAGNRTLGLLHLGYVIDGSTLSESGHVIMNGGTLTIGADDVPENQVLIGEGTVLSTFIQNGGTIMLDAPETGALSTSFKGANEIDWEVGLRGIGRFEMHNDAKFFASDDLKVAENAAGNGYVLMDGNSFVAVGSGVSISSGGGLIEQTMVMAGNSRLDSGNSMGAGNVAGGTDEGYLTMAIGGGKGKLILQDNAQMNIRRLSAREGVSTIIVKNNAQFHIFDVLNGTGTSAATRPAETGPNSTFGSAATSSGTFILQDDAVMTVNSDPASGPTKGLGISAPRDPGNAGGKMTMTIRDRASLTIEQDFMLGTGADAETSDGTLEVIGPDADITIDGNLNMAVDLDGNVAAVDDFSLPTPGKSTLHAVITAASHSTINVGGIARIANGQLKVSLNGHTPAVGTIYTLIQGGTIDGQFASTDLTAAHLEGGKVWQIEYTANAVRLRVAQAGAARNVTVTTANNVNPPVGTVSLLQALTGLQNGDTIRFNIPGAGPHFIETPVGGYPLISADNVTIDGYSQPGATPNSNPILAANNAQLRIVLDSRNGNVRVMDFDPEVNNSGYGTGEAAVLGVYAATNLHVSGLSILAVPQVPDDVSVYGISFAKGASGHISGNWIGVAPDGTTLAGPADGITGFRYRTTAEDPYIMNNGVIVGVSPSSVNAPAEFNVFCGIPAIPIILEGSDFRISGNFFNVYPSGIKDFNPPLADPVNFFGTFEGNIEIGRAGNNTVIGVDGDGVNDANERNIFGGVLPPSMGGYGESIEFYSQNPGTNIVIAGNYFGLGVDGMTRFTNGASALDAAGNNPQYRFGSDFDGVSDSLEGNVVYNNWPPEMFPTTGSESFFDELAAGAIVSARGNVLVNNFAFPASPLKNAGAFWTDYYAKAVADTFAGLVPVLDPSTTANRLVGTVPVANADYPVTIIDLYIADPEGIEYGKTAGVFELPNGYVQGKTYLGSFVDNSAADANKAAGEFDINISGLGADGPLTITANYSKSSAGTRNAIVLTSPFSDPVQVTGVPIINLSIAKTATGIRLTWTGGTGPFTVRRKTNLTDAQWTNVTTTSERFYDATTDGTSGFFTISSGTP
jgi:hypothetical protein